MSSFEQQLANARKEGKKIGKRAKEQGHPAAPLPGSESLAQEQEINEYDITAQQLDDILKQSITFTDKEGNVTETCDHMEDVLETKEGKKICEMFAKEMARYTRNDRDFEADTWSFITSYTALTGLSQEHQKKIAAVFAQEHGSDLSAAIRDVREMFAKEMAAYAQNGRDIGSDAWNFITAYSALTQLSQEDQDKIAVLFTQEYSADLSTAITNVHESFAKDMAIEAQKGRDNEFHARFFIVSYSALTSLPQEHQDKIAAVFAQVYGSALSTAIMDVREMVFKKVIIDIQNGRNNRVNARIFIISITATKTLRDHYQKLSTEQNAQKELTDTTDTIEPLIPQKNF